MPTMRREVELLRAAQFRVFVDFLRKEEMVVRLCVASLRRGSASVVHGNGDVLIRAASGRRRGQEGDMNHLQVWLLGD